MNKEDEGKGRINGVCVDIMILDVRVKKLIVDAISKGLSVGVGTGGAGGAIAPLHFTRGSE